MNFLNISRISMPTTTASQYQLMQKNKNELTHKNQTSDILLSLCEKLKRIKLRSLVVR